MTAQGGTMRFELVPGEGGAPFMVLSDAGAQARVLLARVASGGETLIPVALKLRRDRPRRALSGRPISQREVTEAWRRGSASVRLLAGTPGIVQPLPMVGDPLLGGGRGIVLCSEKWVAFPLVCPTCGTPLAECDDEALLESAGLPTPTAADHVFLICPSCTAVASPVIYSASPTEEIGRHSADLRDFARWTDDFGTDIVSRDPTAVPCVDCDQVSRCFPRTGLGLGADRLTPLAMHATETLPLELLHLHFDEHMALLGGQRWDDLMAERLAGAAYAARRHGLAAVAEPYRSGRQYLFADDHAGAFQLEVLHLKITAFRALLDGVAAVHETLLAPHLRLEPSNVMARLHPRMGDLPARWATSLSLLGPGGAQPLEIPAAGGATGLFQPPREVRQAFSAPPVVTGLAGHGERATVRIESVTGDEFEATVRGGPLEAVANDGLLLQLNAPSLGIQEMGLWGRIAQARRGELRVVGAIPIAGEKALAKARGEALPEVACFHYPTLHVPCDLFSLGRLWMHGLLVNDQQPGAAVVEACDAVMDRTRVSSDADGLRDTLCEAIAVRNELFSPLACLYREEDRRCHQAGCPDLLWEELLLFGFRLMLWLPGFGFCAHRGDYEREFPRGPIDRAIAVLHALGTRVRAHLFGADPFHRAVQEALDRFMGEGGDAEPTGAASPESSLWPDNK